jgi:hypothetical protein
MEKELKLENEQRRGKTPVLVLSIFERYNN